MNINSTSPDKHKYLQVLSCIDNPPSKLYFVGELPKDRVPTIAIVGSRKPTAYGKSVTQKLAYELAQKGVVVVSGLALGVDGIAHQSALESGGVTIAVLPCGLPNIYPATNKQLAMNIIKTVGL